MNMDDENYSGKQTTLADLKNEIQKSEENKKQNSIYRVIEDGKTAMLELTGKIFERQAEYEGKKTDKIGFEISEQTPNGKNKIFEISKHSKIAVQLIELLTTNEKWPYRLYLKRKGIEKNTRYEIIDMS